MQGTLEDISNCPGVEPCYLVTSMAGNVTIDGQAGPITGLVPGGPGPTQIFFDWGYYTYDNLVNPNSSPQLDADGLLFSVSGITYPVNLCADPGCNLSSGSQTWALDYFNGVGIEAFSVDNFDVSVVPDGGMTLVLLGGALVGLQALRRKFRV